MPERYEREIEEIVERHGRDLGPRTPLRTAFADLQRRTRDNLRRQTPSFLRVFTPRRVGTLGVVLLLAAFVSKESYLAVLSVGVLMTAYLLALVRGVGENEGQGWRGRSIEHRQAPAWVIRFRSWFGRKPRRP